MKLFLTAGVIFGLLTTAVTAAVRTEGAASGEWTQDVEAARALAKAEGKYLFMNFTGSDLCGLCKLMDEHVFSQPGWQAWARESLALAFVDFPRDKELVPKAFRARNKELKKEHGIRGYPTFVLFAPDGHEAGRLGAIRSGNDFTFITNVTAVIVEDRIADYVTPEELAEYRQAQADKAAWEAKNGEAQTAFRVQIAEPNRKAADAAGREIGELLAKGTAAWRAALPPAAPVGELRFADFGAGVITNGAAAGAWTSDFEAARKLA